MTKVLVATDKAFAPVAVKGIREVIENAGFELILLESYTSPEDFIKAITDVDAVIVRSDKMDKTVIEAAANLKIAVRAGAGYDNIDLAASTAKGIVVMNTPGQNSNAVAELALGLMVYYVRNFFNGKSGWELKDKKLGIHAYGAVGRNVARIAKGFVMDCYAFDPFISEDVFKTSGVKFCKNPEDLYSNCQYVTLHMPANDKTKKSIGYDLLKRMPEDAVLVNAARKELIDEDGLLKIFSERTDIKYLSDGEPDCKAIIEERYKGRLIFTAKKMGAQTEEANINAGVAAARQIVDFFKTGNIKFKVNR